MGCLLPCLMMAGLIMFRMMFAGLLGYLFRHMLPGGSMLYDMFLIGVGMLIYKFAFANRAEPLLPAQYAYPVQPPPQPMAANPYPYGPGVAYPMPPAAPR